MSTAVALFPPEVFVDHLLVTISDSDVRIPGSTMSYHLHARQAAALATHVGLGPPAIAASLLYGFGEIVVRSWARHPARGAPIDATEAAIAHLGLHLPASVTCPIALLDDARVYLEEARTGGMIPSLRCRRFESEPHAADALELANIDAIAGKGPMITPTLGTYRALLSELCGHIAADQPMRGNATYGRDLERSGITE
jgi:predicted HD phosphohydrolase